MLKLTLLVLATLGLANSAEDSGTGNAKLLVSKRVSTWYYEDRKSRNLYSSEKLMFCIPSQIQNKYLVEGKDVVIHYGLYNVGDNAATEVVLSEVSSGENVH